MILQEPFAGEMNTCCRQYSCGLGIYPIVFTVCSTLTIIITYSISVSNDHVYPYFPAISDTGGIKPESNVFGFLLSCCGFLGFVVVTLRYYQYRFISENNEEWHSRLIWLNRIAWIFGLISVGGVIVVAAFQDRGVSLRMHIAGALCVFGGGVIYCFFQTYLSLRMLSCGMNTRRLCWIRILISLSALGFFIGNMVTQSYASDRWSKYPNPQNITRAKWTPDIPGFEYNVATNVCEWLMAFSFFFYFVTFVGEFNKVKMSFNMRNNELNMFLPFQRSTSSDVDPNSYVGPYA